MRHKRRVPRLRNRSAAFLAGAGCAAAVACAVAVGVRPGPPPRLLRSAQPVTLPHGPAAPGARTAISTGGGWTIAVDGWQIRVEGLAAFVGTRTSTPDRAVERSADDAARSYADLIVSHAVSQGLDWQLVAAVIEAESNFDPTAMSERGAVGLMQVRPAAAADVGEEEFHAPEDNIRTGTKYLRYLARQLADVHPGERLPFVLAAYHMGIAHVRDAQALAEFLGFSPRLWHGHVERVLHLLEEPAVYTKLAAGYAQGRRTLAYVRRVMERYQELALSAPTRSAEGSARSREGGEESPS